MKSGCEHAVEYVYLFLDREISFFQKSRVTAHLKRCAQCTDAYAFERRLKALIRERGRTEPRPELFEALRALIEQERKGNEPPVGI